MELTESETEYVVRCVKHTFNKHIVFQVRGRREEGRGGGEGREGGRGGEREGGRGGEGRGEREGGKEERKEGGRGGEGRRGRDGGGREERSRTVLCGYAEVLVQCTCTCTNIGCSSCDLLVM